MIYSKNSSPPARIQRWVLRLQSYDFIVKYRPGAQNIAGALSRLTTNVTLSTNDAEDFIRLVARNSVPDAITIQEVERESGKDPELSVVRNCILNENEWENVDVAFRSVRQELSVLGETSDSWHTSGNTQIVAERDIEPGTQGSPGNC